MRAMLLLFNLLPFFLSLPPLFSFHLCPGRIAFWSYAPGPGPSISHSEPCYVIGVRIFPNPLRTFPRDIRIERLLT